LQVHRVHFSSSFISFVSVPSLLSVDIIETQIDTFNSYSYRYYLHRALPARYTNQVRQNLVASSSLQDQPLRTRPRLTSHVPRPKPDLDTNSSAGDRARTDTRQCVEMLPDIRISGKNFVRAQVTCRYAYERD